MELLNLRRSFKPEMSQKKLDHNVPEQRFSFQSQFRCYALMVFQHFQLQCGDVTHSDFCKMIRTCFKHLTPHNFSSVFMNYTSNPSRFSLLLPDMTAFFQPPTELSQSFILLSVSIQTGISVFRMNLFFHHVSSSLIIKVILRTNLSSPS